MPVNTKELKPPPSSTEPPSVKSKVRQTDPVPSQRKGAILVLSVSLPDVEIKEWSSMLHV